MGWGKASGGRRGSIEMLSADHNTLFLITPVLLKLRVGREVRSEGLKLSWKKKGWIGENV